MSDKTSERMAAELTVHLLTKSTKYNPNYEAAVNTLVANYLDLKEKSDELKSNHVNELNEVKEERKKELIDVNKKNNWKLFSFFVVGASIATMLISLFFMALHMLNIDGYIINEQTYSLFLSIFQWSLAPLGVLLIGWLRKSV